MVMNEGGFMQLITIKKSIWTLIFDEWGFSLIVEISVGMTCYNNVTL